MTYPLYETAQHPLATRPVTSNNLDVVAIGDAIVDVIATAPDSNALVADLASSSRRPASRFPSSGP